MTIISVSISGVACIGLLDTDIGIIGVATPGHKANFCSTLGDSNLGDDYPSSNGAEYLFNDAGVAKYVLNKTKKTIFLMARGTTMGVDNAGNLFSCVNGDAKIGAQGSMNILSTKDITIQTPGQVNLVGKNKLAIFSGAKSVLQSENNRVLLTGSSIIKNPS
jgi:hypothetical protein